MKKSDQIQQLQDELRQSRDNLIWVGAYLLFIGYVLGRRSTREDAAK